MIDKIIQEFTGEMSGMLSAEQNKAAMEALQKVLGKYTIAEVSEKEAGELLPKFIAAKRVEGCSEKSLKYYESTIRNMLTAIEKPEQEITTDDLRGYLDAYQQTNNISKVTLDNVRRILSSFFSWLEDEDYIVKSPVRRIHKVKTTKTVKETESKDNHGDLSHFVFAFLSILKDGLDFSLQEIKQKNKAFKNLTAKIQFKGSKSDKQIVEMLTQAKIYGSFGLSAQQIASQSKISMPTVNRCVKKLKDAGLLDITHLGKRDFLRIKE